MSVYDYNLTVYTMSLLKQFSCKYIYIILFCVFLIPENPCDIGLFSCENGGECYVLNLKAKCACPNGFSGVNCSCKSSNRCCINNYIK